MSITAFIFARSRSKGLKEKNIKFFSGKPLIYWAIKTAQQSKKINRIIVSTDSTKIAKMANKFGAETPFIRPKRLGSDKSPEWHSWQHALNFLLRSEKKLPNLFISLPVTSPLRSYVDVDNMINVFNRNKNFFDGAIAVRNSTRNPYFNMVKIDKNSRAKICFQSRKKIFRRQDCPKVYDMTTVAFIAKPNFVINNKNLFDGRVLAHIVNNEISLDIDSQLDFDIAEFLKRKINKRTNRKK
tara:strand:+ start:621 stop:1343 length:723 start_codon:yes stop_codon:yes gene_type:complete